MIDSQRAFLIGSKNLRPFFLLFFQAVKETGMISVISICQGVLSILCIVLKKKVPLKGKVIQVLITAFKPLRLSAATERKSKETKGVSNREHKHIELHFIF